MSPRLFVRLKIRWTPGFLKVRVDQNGTLAGLGECNREVGGGGRLALALRRARDENGLHRESTLAKAMFARSVRYDSAADERG